MYARGAGGTLLVGRLCTGGKTGKNVLEFFRRGTFRRFAPQLLNHGSQVFGVVLLCVGGLDLVEGFEGEDRFGLFRE